MTTIAANETAVPVTLKIGETFESLTWRVHRYMSSVEATNIKDARRRGKLCMRLTLTDEIATHGSGDLDGVVIAMVSLAARNVDVGYMDTILSIHTVTGGTRISRKLQGIPAMKVDRAAVFIEGKNVSVKVSETNLVIRNLVDKANEPTAMHVEKKGPSLALTWAKEHAAKIVGGMTYQDVLDGLREAGVQVRSHCAMD